VIEKDNIQELFSKAFENHASAVKPELWTGVQAKMAAAGMVGGTAAVKGISALTKWIIGTAAVTTIGVTTYLVVDNDKPAEKPTESNTTITTPSSSETPIDETKTVAFDQNSGSTNLMPNGATPSQNTVPNGGVTSNDEIFLESAYGTVNRGFERNNNVEPNHVESTPFISGNESTPNSGGLTNTSTETTPVYKAKVSERHTVVREPEPTKTEVSTIVAKVEVPNVFSPNFDTKNDYFELISEENVSKVEITILDPNGKKVFVSDDKNFKWNGNNMSDEPCAQGIYSYQLVYFDLNGKANLKGDYIYLQR